MGNNKKVSFSEESYSKLWGTQHGDPRIPQQAVGHPSIPSLRLATTYENSREGTREFLCRALRRNPP